MTGGGRRREALALALLLAAGAWPWLGGLGAWPTTSDPAVWIGHSATFHPGWAAWVLGGPHFGWYRPVTALSFTLNQVATGLAAAGFRATDLALHLAAAALLFRLFVRLAPDLPRWAALVAVAVFLGHPIVEETVPYMARRSYTLAAVLGYGALLLIAGRCAAGRARIVCPATLGSAALLVAALYSNEAAIVTALVAPPAAWAACRGQGQVRRAVLRTCALPALAMVLALAVRTLVLGGVGGYESGSGEGGLEVLASVWRGAGAITAALPGWLAWPMLFAVPWIYAGLALRTRAGALFLAWTAACAVLFATSGVWFERQLYVVLGPLALTLAAVLGATATRFPRRPVRALLALVPQLLLLGTIAWSSPVLRGPDPQRVERFRERTRSIDVLLEQARRCVEPAFVAAALAGARDQWRTDPVKGLHRSNRQAVKWVRVLLHDRDVELEDVLYFRATGAGVPVAFEDGRRPALRIAPDVEVYVQRGERFVAVPGAQARRLFLDELVPATDRRTYLLLSDGATGELRLLREAP